MPAGYIKDSSPDLTKLPPADLTVPTPDGFNPSDPPVTTISIGDLHGNTIKFLWILQRHGIITNLNDKNYNKLREIYNKDVRDLEREDIDEFNKILSELKFNTHIKLCLIGDELADRGSNDYFTLKLLERLHDSGVKTDIILSNHGAEFVQAVIREKIREQSIIGDKLSKAMRTSTQDYLENGETYSESFSIKSDQIVSMNNLQILIKKRLITKKDVKNIAEEIYLPKLNLISYTLESELDGGGITLSTHAPVGIENIKKLAEKMEISYKDSTAKDLAETIDAINEKYRKDYLDAKEEKKEYKDVFNIYDKEDPIRFFLWNRDYDIIERPKHHAKHGYPLRFAHGHDIDLSKKEDKKRFDEHIFNLDNDLGKEKESEAEHDEYHYYSCFYSGSLPVTPSKDLKDKLVIIPLSTEAKREEKSEEKLTAIEKPSPLKSKVSNKDKEVELPVDWKKQLEEQQISIAKKAGNLLLRYQESGNTLTALYNAYLKANNLSVSLKTSLENLQPKHDSTTNKYLVEENKLTEFKANCMKSINDARPELEKHRGWKQLLLNTAQILSGIGIVAGIVNYKVNKQFFFKVKTDSAKKLDALEKFLNTEPTKSPLSKK